MALRAAPRQFSTSASLVQPLPLMTGAGAPPRTRLGLAVALEKIGVRLDAPAEADIGVVAFGFSQITHVSNKAILGD